MARRDALKSTVSQHPLGERQKYTWVRSLVHHRTHTIQSHTHYIHLKFNSVLIIELALTCGSSSCIRRQRDWAPPSLLRVFKAILRVQLQSHEPALHITLATGFFIIKPLFRISLIEVSF